MSGARTATEVIVISLGSVTVDSEPVQVSEGTFEDDLAQIQTAGMVPDSADAGPARVSVEENTTEELITTSVKVPVAVPEPIPEPVPESLPELAPEKAPEKKREKETEKNTEKTDLEPVPTVAPVQEDTLFRKEPSGGIQAGLAHSGEPAQVPTEGSAEASVSAGPPKETMIAYAGAEIIPGILSAGSGPGEGDRLVSAVAVTLPRPSYPRVCRRRGQEGTVVLSVVVGVDGRPGRILVVDTSGFSRLDRAAEEALESAVFQPARQGGLFTESVKQVAFTFRLEDGGD
jgi:protein TonB